MLSIWERKIVRYVEERRKERNGKFGIIRN
jgi:hypothetical protein